MQFELTLLGTNSALPAFDRFPTSQVLNVEDRAYLIDCGEGTQIRMQQYPVRRGRISQIFISHLHGDHIFGLIGLLTSFGLNGREEPVDVFSPPGLQPIIEVQLKLGAAGLPFALRFHEVDPTRHSRIFADRRIEVFTLPLRHRIPTTGYLFREHQRPSNIRPEQIKKYDIPFGKIPAIKAGAELSLADGTVISNERLTIPAPPPRSYAFCSDTRYEPAIVPLIRDVDLLYHESTFCEDQRQQAELTMHSTAREAALIARDAGVGRLILGHYSSRYRDLTPFLEEARAVFPATELGEDGRTFSVAFRGRDL